jgi:hypothetical protein
LNFGLQDRKGRSPVDEPPELTELRHARSISVPWRICVWLRPIVRVRTHKLNEKLG